MKSAFIFFVYQNQFVKECARKIRLKKTTYYKDKVSSKIKELPYMWPSMTSEVILD